MAALRKCDSSVFSPLMAVRGGLSGSFRCAGRPYPFLFLFLARDAREGANGVAVVREDDGDVSQVTSGDDEGEGLSIRSMAEIWVWSLNLGFPIRYLILGCSLVARVVARKALMVVAMGVKVVGVDNSVLADLE
ncbi:hypothetical protein LR48_Vigan03g183300 [Vigna angularis]|uniref:Uncharacterized protein n=1 Tax=Phaseolus angularis TaxID=3914 RepID=A0A0L9U6S9_PHAAN|nr:hypothetical protein LR48_Vigan03g183300 [Vigna angularis]